MKNCAFGIPDGLVANEARLFDDEVLVDAPSAEIVAANSSLTLVNKIQTQRANERLVILTRCDGLILAISSRAFCRHLVIYELLDVLYVDVGGHKLLLLDHFMDLPELFFTIDYGLGAVFEVALSFMGSFFNLVFRLLIINQILFELLDLFGVQVFLQLVENDLPVLSILGALVLYLAHKLLDEFIDLSFCPHFL